MHVSALVCECLCTHEWLCVAEGAELFSGCALGDGHPVLPRLPALLELPGPWEAASQSGESMLEIQGPRAETLCHLQRIPSPCGALAGGCPPPKILAVGGAGTRPQHVLLPLFFLPF